MHRKPTMKVTRILALSNFALLLAATVALRAADGGTIYQAKPGSKIRMEGTSNIHDWQVEGNIIGGNVEVGSDFPLDPTKAKPGKVDVKATVSIPVRSMKSIEKDGRPYNAKMDDIMYEKLLEPANKVIKFVLAELVVKEAGKAATDPVVFEARGDLAVAGKTKSITMPVKMTVLPEDKLKFSGSVALKMTDFGITPPEPLGLGIKTGDDVKLIFDWMTGKKK
jgi:polyisoprenoid-binding protein YceI